MAESRSRPNGPTLNALRAFESAARHESFALAADELCVTSGAVAQQIKTLEAWAGDQLFFRHAQGVQLSRAGVAALPGLTAAFDQMGEASQCLRNEALPEQLQIATLPSIAQLWLLPRLPSIHALLPEVNISVTVTENENPPNLLREPFDLTLFFETDPDHPHWCDLGPDEIFPVCTPALGTRLVSPDDLHDVSCVRDFSWSDDWDKWGQVAYPDATMPADGPVHTHFTMALEETRAGGCVLIGHRALVEADLASGRLIMPFDRTVTLERQLIAGTAVSPEEGSALAALLTVLAAGERCSLVD
ncbi:MAG: LysR family transcriptional regulator [Rhodobacteraceae bacterium]|nr:LysR family transcriptional regulator [Paracoccaceae bacterium]